jgi:hypothetical protein
MAIHRWNREYRHVPEASLESFLRALEPWLDILEWLELEQSAAGHHRFS